MIVNVFLFILLLGILGQYSKLWDSIYELNKQIKELRKDLNK